MTDKKFTDEEIIKALECCVKVRNCGECPAKDEPVSECLIAVCEKAAGIIKCQKAEIENAKAKIKICDEVIERQEAEIENLKSELSNTRRKALLEASSKFAGHSNYHGDTILSKLICMAEGQEVDIAIPLDMSEIKAEAYKEFAERLKEYMDIGHLSPPSEICLSELMVAKLIDNFLREIIGRGKYYEKSNWLY